ncbi:cupin domain-containing protein [Dethiosulfatarculus sandiegensis]|uniref:Cupin type-2 domain-containing protein n=1 Tax=Dethiosulfatarculus sandiegensis TaxID=1429043 RepID=A0A0D2HWT4_9BACT|nr:cupin domain-containing protein [Dethiosulfatarculus sandiegensis]KIX14838.1 hypothetical protein X474_06750 [Dethiosulfatarculus sandiegensis]
MSNQNQSPFASFIQNWPKADIPMQGFTAHLLSGGNGQAVFFEIPGGSEVPPHSHGAQWGIVVSGELELTIGGETKTYGKGDTYTIGDGEEHSAITKDFACVIDVFADSDRYQKKA